MECDFMKSGKECANLADDCGMPTRADIFFYQYPNAPRRNGIPYVFPCMVDKMSCNFSLCKPNFDDNHCWLCTGRYWSTKICNK